MAVKKPLRCFENSYVYERYPDHPLVHVTILVNAYRLSRKLYQSFLEVLVEQVYQFMSGFVSSGSKEFWIENSGPAKKDKTQRIDYLFSSYYDDPICREVLIGARAIDLNRILQISDSWRDTKNHRVTLLTLKQSLFTEFPKTALPLVFRALSYGLVLEGTGTRKYRRRGEPHVLNCF